LVFELDENNGNNSNNENNGYNDVLDIDSIISNIYLEMAVQFLNYGVNKLKFTIKFINLNPKKLAQKYFIQFQYHK
jgi:hypothetical protein